jgi:hypothetical protein
MAESRATPRGFIRDNVFLVAAVLLPVVVIVFFLLFTIIPRWMVAPPRYDLLVQTTEYDGTPRRVNVEVFVRDDRLQMSVRPPGENTYGPRVRVWRVDHSTLTPSEIQLHVPDQMPANGGSTTVVDALRNERVVTDVKAPDGYQIQTTTHDGPGFVGDLFGMRRYDRGLVVANRGRVISIRIPTQNVYQTPTFVGWMVPEGVR